MATVETPLTIIVITPVRNEAWVLDAYLTCTSSWADYIILADQHSTDGSREIATKYEKVILVDNDLPEMNQAAARLLVRQESQDNRGLFLQLQNLDWFGPERSRQKSEAKQGFVDSGQRFG